METLYITDLDGTLLGTDDRVSDFTKNTINTLIEKGLPFTYATARSFASASVVTTGLRLRLPVIVYNGAFLFAPDTGAALASSGFDGAQKRHVAAFLGGRGLFPLVYAFVDGVEKVSWLAGQENDGMRRYLDARRGDRRLNPVADAGRLYAGDAFYFTCIGEESALAEVYAHFSAHPDYRCTLQQELYRPEFWCEIYPQAAGKANAVARLKERLGCRRVVSFGDSLNDVGLFEASDETYAVENALPQLKETAGGTIESNERDGVARWLLAHAGL